MKKLLISITVCLSIATFLVFFYKIEQKRIVSMNGQMSPIIDKMPLVQNDPFAAMASNLEPIAERGQHVARWLEPGVRIQVTDALGSGTIIFFDRRDGFAYIQSCGHLWDGNMSAEEGKKRGVTCKVFVQYKEGKKLTEPIAYPATVLFYNNNNKDPHLCQDVSLLRFKPDFEPNYFPVAPAEYQVQQGQILHSVGCDHGSEVAHYGVRIIGERGEQWTDLVTTENSPRPGRSGGGLISDDAVYVGICWGTTQVDGKGNGYFTPLRTIRFYNETNGYGWLNDVRGLGSPARRLPIIDRNNEQLKYLEGYIPLPNER